MRWTTFTLLNFLWAQEEPNPIESICVIIIIIIIGLLFLEHMWYALVEKKRSSRKIFASWLNRGQDVFEASFYILVDLCVRFENNYIYLVGKHVSILFTRMHQKLTQTQNIHHLYNVGVINVSSCLRARNELSRMYLSLASTLGVNLHVALNESL